MNEKDQVTLLDNCKEGSLPAYALLRLRGRPMTADEQERCERFCTGLEAKLLGQEGGQPTPFPGFVPTLDNMSALFQRFPRNGLPAYAVKLVENVLNLGPELTESELRECETFAAKLVARVE